MVTEANQMGPIAKGWHWNRFDLIVKTRESSVNNRCDDTIKLLRHSTTGLAIIITAPARMWSKLNVSTFLSGLALRL